MNVIYLKHRGEYAFWTGKWYKIYIQIQMFVNSEENIVSET